VLQPHLRAGPAGAVLLLRSCGVARRCLCNGQICPGPIPLQQSSSSTIDSDAVLQQVRKGDAASTPAWKTSRRTNTGRRVRRTTLMVRRVGAAFACKTRLNHCCPYAGALHRGCCCVTCSGAAARPAVLCRPHHTWRSQRRHRQVRRRHRSIVVSRPGAGRGPHRYRPGQTRFVRTARVVDARAVERAGLRRAAEASRSDYAVRC